MLLNENKINIETSNDLEEKFFSIDNLGMIFDILRNKMYYNPILAICREYSCNARDAHREVETPEIPIQIHLPTNLEPYYKIKDFGPGISPDRMENIFIKYTASSKRNDNIQTGGFGLGSKTGFSYSDTFTITTNVNGKQYHYSCFIDETKIGKLSLMHEASTKEPNGTEIQIPVKDKNFTDFATQTEQACRHWDVKPIIKGGDISWKDNKIILEGNKWAMTERNYHQQAKAIIDGIEYPLEMNSLRQYADVKLIDACHGSLILFFGIGELSLSANREQVFLDEKTKKIIRQRLENITEEVKQKAINKINACDNLWQANLYYRKELKSFFHTLDFLGRLTWKEAPLTDQYIYTNCNVFYFRKGGSSRRFRSSDPDKIKRSTNKHLSFDETTELYLNDLPLKEPTLRHIKKAFDGNPGLMGVQVLSPNEKFTLQDLEASDLNLMAPKKLSSIAKASGRTYTPASSRLLVFKFNQTFYAFRQTSYASVEEDSNKKVLILLSRYSSLPADRHPYLKSKKHLSLGAIKSLTKRYPDYSFYGLDADTDQKRIDEDFSDMIDIEDFIKDIVLANNNLDYIKIKFANTNYHHISCRSSNFEKIKPFVNSNSLFIKRLELHQKLKEFQNMDADLLDLYENYNGEISLKELASFAKKHPEFDIAKINKEYEGRYPLLEHISYYDFEDAIEHIAQYINLIDLHTKEK
jgi:Histidine kinase-, DNA gyrase B-, and HSP90-like ATPase